MLNENNDNLYILEEEEQETENSPLNYAAYEEEDLEEEKEFIGEKKKSPFAILFNIMFNPVEGWKTLRRSKIEVESLQSGCYYPLLAILAISKFAEYFYSVNVSLSQIITDAIVSFVAFFFGFFCIQIVISMFLSKEAKENFEGKFGKEYIMIALSTLAIFSIVTDLLPMIWPILIFLPIWTFYLMFKGVRFFKFHEKEEIKFFIISAASVIGIPLMIEWLLNAVLPY